MVTKSDKEHVLISSTQTTRTEEFKKRSIFQRIDEIMAYILLEGGKKKNSIKVLDTVRAIAILSVVFYHISVIAKFYQATWLGHTAYNIINAGNAGVTLFFVLSGFLLFLPYIKSLLFDGNWPSVRQFYLRRALRILPGYYISLFLIVLLAAPVYLQPDHLKQLLLFITLFMDSSNKTWQAINAPFWSLAVEWQFYIFLPWIALAMRPIVQRGSLKRRAWMLFGCLTILVIWGMESRYWGYRLTVDYPDQTFGLPHNIFKLIIAVPYGHSGKSIEEFAFGMAAAVCYMLAKNTGVKGGWNTILCKLSPWLLIFSVLWLFFMAKYNAVFYQQFSFPTQLSFLFGHDSFTVFHEVGLALGYSCFTLAILFAGPTITRIFEWEPLRWIGLISYSIYIWHNPILLPFAGAVSPFVQNWSNLRFFLLLLGWAVVAIPTFSLVYFALVERPFMKINDRLRKKPVDIKPEILAEETNKEITLKREAVALPGV